MKAKGIPSEIYAPSPFSPSPSPSPSPTPTSAYTPGASSPDAAPTPAGCCHPSVYTRLLPRWRAKTREWLVWHLENNENALLVEWQSRLRSEFWDWWFAQASLAGTHTFFFLFLPLFYWFGFPHLGASVVHTLSIGIYITSYLKDLFCVPRPYCPPLHRLTSGTSHALEYGFPSTHSTNAVSMGLFLIADVVSSFGPSSWVSILSITLLCIYMASVVLSRLYCGMHSIIDCVVGIMLGVAVFYLALEWETPIADWTATAGWVAPALAVPLTLLLVSVHPEPVDDCPCFEDAIAIVSVSLGIYIAHWQIVTFGVALAGYTRGSPLTDNPDLLIFLGTSIAKVVMGVGLVFLWRLVAKETLHAVLPPIFRTVAPYLVLPRRHYTQATRYKKYESADAGLHPIPSVLDLTALGDHQLHDQQSALVQRRGGKKNEKGEKVEEKVEREERRMPSVEEEEEEPEGIIPAKKIKHYDVDVLTRFFVYSGIGYISSFCIPYLYTKLGLGVLSA